MLRVRTLKLQVAKPRIGENHPARVSADVTVNLNLKPEIKREWESAYPADSLSLLSIYNTMSAVNVLLCFLFCLSHSGDMHICALILYRPRSALYKSLTYLLIAVDDVVVSLVGWSRLCTVLSDASWASSYY